MDLITTIKGSLLEDFFPKGWNLKRLDRCCNNPPRSITNHQRWWHSDFNPIPCEDLSEFDIMSLYESGSMTSTHSGSPLPVVSAIESLKIIQKENLVENARRLGEILIPELERIKDKYTNRLGCVQGRGLVAGIQVVKKGTKEPDPDTALKINERCFRKGLLMFAPVGVAGGCIKISPPLVINEEALREGIAVLEESIDEVLG